MDMYADFTYYSTEYAGKLVQSADFPRMARKASRLLDVITTGKLKFAFPTVMEDMQAVKDCQCELAELLTRVEQYQNTALESMGAVTQTDGTVKGKVISSVSSGSESVSYSIGGGVSSSLVEAAKDKKVLDELVYDIIRDALSGIPDANGVNLLYAGPYPGKRELWA